MHVYLFTSDATSWLQITCFVYDVVRTYLFAYWPSCVYVFVSCSCDVFCFLFQYLHMHVPAYDGTSTRVYVVLRVMHGYVYLSTMHA